jgi:hypothetical protein
LWLLIDLLSLKTDVNAPKVSKKQKNLGKKLIFVGIFKAAGQKSRTRICNPVYGFKDVDPDLYQNGPDSGHCSVPHKFYQGDSFGVNPVIRIRIGFEFM